MADLKTATVLRLHDVGERLASLCQRCKVKRLDLFGSAVTGEFDPTRSDLDFVVMFEELRPAAYARAYFELREGLIELFERPVDLVTSAGLKNPHFMSRFESERQNLYVA